MHFMTIYVVISTFQQEARPDKPVRPDWHGPPRPAERDRPPLFPALRSAPTAGSGASPKSKILGAGASVVEEELAGEEFAETGEQLDAFERGEVGHGGGHGAEDGKLAHPSWRGLGVEAGQARGLARNDGGELTFHVEHGGIDERLALAHTLAIHEKALLKERRAVEDEVGFRDEMSGVVFGDVLRYRFDLKAWIQLEQTAPAGLDARFSQLVVGLEDLAVEVAWLGVAGVREDELSDSSGRERMGKWTAQPADTRDEGGGGFQFGLALIAEAVDPDLPFVDGAFFSGQGHEISWRAAA